MRCDICPTALGKAASGSCPWDLCMEPGAEGPGQGKLQATPKQDRTLEREHLLSRRASNISILALRTSHKSPACTSGSLIPCWSLTGGTSTCMRPWEVIRLSSTVKCVEHIQEAPTPKSGETCRASKCVVAAPEPSSTCQWMSFLPLPQGPGFCWVSSSPTNYTSRPKLQTQLQSQLRGAHRL